VQKGAKSTLPTGIFKESGWSGSFRDLWVEEASGYRLGARIASLSRDGTPYLTVEFNNLALFGNHEQF